MPQTPYFQRHFSSAQVAGRCLMRVTLLGLFATFGQQGFGQAFAVTLVLSAIFCTVAGIIRNEAVFGSALSNWDEAAVYLLMAIATTWLT
jgi:hypothetical protein